MNSDELFIESIRAAKHISEKPPSVLKFWEEEDTAIAVTQQRQFGRTCFIAEIIDKEFSPMKRELDGVYEVMGKSGLNLFADTPIWSPVGTLLDQRNHLRESLKGLVSAITTFQCAQVTYDRLNEISVGDKVTEALDKLLDAESKLQTELMTAKQRLSQYGT